MWSNSGLATSTARHCAREIATFSRFRLKKNERDPVRVGQARDFLDWGEVADKVEIIEGDALEVIKKLPGPFDMIFLDASKGEYAEYLRLAEPKASDRALLVIDNVLMGGSVAFGEGERVPEGFGTHWAEDSRAAGRVLNAELMSSKRWLSAVLPIGDGVAPGARRATGGPEAAPPGDGPFERLGHRNPFGAAHIASQSKSASGEQ
jgi:predicted O-methyltransferase YrrM